MMMMEVMITIMNASMEERNALVVLMGGWGVDCDWTDVLRVRLRLRRLKKGQTPTPQPWSTPNNINTKQQQHQQQQQKTYNNNRKPTILTYIPQQDGWVWVSWGVSSRGGCSAPSSPTQRPTPSSWVCEVCLPPSFRRWTPKLSGGWFRRMMGGLRRGWWVVGWIMGDMSGELSELSRLCELSSFRCANVVNCRNHERKEILSRDGRMKK